MLGEELAVNYTRKLSIFGYVAVKVGLKFTRNVWFSGSTATISSSVL